MFVIKESPSIYCQIRINNISKMFEFQNELNLAKLTVIRALETLKTIKPSQELFGVDSAVPKEMKSKSDNILEEIIISCLKPTGLNILSEELGLIEQGIESKLTWIVDPLDGTVNFVRGIGGCSVSLALFKESEPIFGVIGEFPSCKLFWGGRKFGSYDGNNSIYVSDISAKSQSVICSGFPSRFDFNSRDLLWISDVLSNYAKVRMLGSASISLIQVAKGSAEAYAERNIMLWDVAAGLAIIEGAGGNFIMESTGITHSVNVFASNGKIREKVD